VIMAIGSMHFEWLNWVWAFGKNYLGPRRSKHSEKITLANFFSLIKKEKNNKVEHY